jgi:type I restriction enzyme R subunit
MLYTEKGTVENFIIQELKKLGWKYVSPEEMKLKRMENFEEPLVIEDLRNALVKINKGVELTDADLDYVIVSLRTISANLEGIRTFLDRFRNGLVVPIQKEAKERVIKLVDLENAENNEFTVTNQFKVEGLKGTIRADVVLLVNGIPLALIECKNPTVEKVDWTDAYKQIKRYEDQAPELFKYVQFSIATDGMKTYYFPNAFNEENRDFLSVWKDPYPFKAGDLGGDMLKMSIHGLLSRQNLLDLIENFTFIRKERDKSTKVMARYQQFRASNRIFQRVVNTLLGKDDKKFGLIWHWQGSGKTYTMAFTAWKLFHCPEAKRPSIFVMVDRKELEEQIEKDFSFIEVPIEKVRSIRELMEILKWGGEGKRGIFLVTIEKFSPKEFMQLKREGGRIGIEREDVIVLADEVHRTHYGKFETMMRSVFKKAFFFGFTGTPLSKMERNTFQKFCPEGELYLDRYSMLDALNDGFTVPLAYQARLPEYHLNKRQFDEFIKFEEEEIEALSKEEQVELKRKVRVIKAFAKKRERIRAIAQDIANHFREVVEPTGLGALVVTIDREACVLYRDALNNFLPQSYSEIVMTFSPNDKGIIRDYAEKMEAEHGTKDTKEIHRKVIESFKSGKGPRILIVTDMLITGFDAPNLWTMYMDKPLREHRVLQAIARTNRPFLNKKFGLIVDYIGVLGELERAFEKFEAGDSKDLRIVIRDLQREKEEFKELMAKSMKIFEGVKREDTRESLESALNLLVDPDLAKSFEATVRELMKSYEMLRGDPFLMDYLLDYTWLVKIFVAYNKRFKKASINELKIDELSRKTTKLIQETLDVKEIEDAYPTVSVDQKYIEALMKNPPRTIGAAMDIMADIRHEIRTHPTSSFFASLSKEVERTYEELTSRKVRTGEAVKRLLTLSERIAEWKREEEEIGKDKYPLYEALKSVLPQMEKQRALNFISELLAHLHKKKLIFNGWQLQRNVRRDVKAEIRLLLISRLRNYREKIDELTEGIFEALEAQRWTM